MTRPAIRLVRLREYVTTSAVQLNSSQVEVLRQARVAAAPVGRGCYDLRPEAIVGVLEVDGVRFEIAPKMGIPRLLQLLTYGLSRRRSTDLDGSFGSDVDLVEAMATLYAEALDRTLARGVRRDYVRRSASSSTLRGRIDLARQLRNHHGRMPPVELTFDDHTVDTPSNRLLLTAALKLRTLRVRSIGARRMLGLALGRLEGVTPEDYASTPLPPAPTAARRDPDLELALMLARLIVAGRSIEIRSGDLTAAAMLFNLNDVFEDFVVAALGERLGLDGRSWPQNAAGHPLYLDRDRRVKLEPDLSWWDRNRCLFVGDVKYKRTSVRGVTHPDLYQLMSYVAATGLADGLLVYADGVAGTVTHVVPGDRRLHVTRLDVSGTLAEMEQEVDRVAGLARSLTVAALSTAS
jgi:5-methylcytosine-specific restriction enzyme subunit McrC